MLFNKAIDTRTLELLKKLMQLSSLSETRLVGGTALALQFGHRQSVDLDLFGKLYEDVFLLAEQINQLGEVTTLQNSTHIHIYLINGIKVDIVDYPYPWIDAIKIIEDLRLGGLKDIAAMKLSAITGRGSRKDFIDLYYLLQKYQLEELMEFYLKKYCDGSAFLVLKSLIYFEDAEREQNPKLHFTLDWLEVKRFIVGKVNDYLSRKKKLE